MFSPIHTLYTYFPVQFFIRLTIDLLIAAFGIFLSVRLYRKGRFDKVQAAAGIILFIWGAFVLMLTVLGRRTHEDEYGLNLVFFDCYQKIFVGHDKAMLRSVLQNIIMFIPIGFTLSIVFKNKHRFIIPLAISFGLSLTIETSQLVLDSGYFELDDIFNNTMGALFGILLSMLISLIIRRIRIHRKEEPIESENHC